MFVKAEENLTHFIHMSVLQRVTHHKDARSKTTPKWHRDHIHNNMYIQNNPHKMRYSHEMNDEWFIAFHFDSFPYFRFHFYTMLWQLVSIRFICHMPHSILQLNYVIVIAFALQLPLVCWNMALDILLSIYIFSHIFQMARI